MLLGGILMLAAIFLLLSLATYQASDPSLNTNTGASGPHTVKNWIGPVGAYVSDLLLQAFGVTAFAFPLWIGGLGLVWIRSLSNGSAWLRWLGILLTLAFLPATLALLPWRLQWPGNLAVEGVTGRLLADWLMAKLNLQGASILCGVLSAAGVYLGSNFSFRDAWEWCQERSVQLAAWNDRWRNWKADRADKKAEREAIHQAERGTGQDLEEAESRSAATRAPGGFARMFGFLRRKRTSDEDLLEDVPTFQRMGARRAAEEEAGLPNVAALPRRPSIWEKRSAQEAQIPLAPNHASAAPEFDEVPIARRVDDYPVTAAQPGIAGPSFTEEPVRVSTRVRASASAEEFAARTEHPRTDLRPSYESFVAEPATQPAPPSARTPAPTPTSAQRERVSRSESSLASVTIHERADVDMRTATVAPKNVTGFKLPPSTLLTAGEEPLAIREDLLREEARKLVEKCAEFKVNGQVVQINPGPMVTTYEFKPDASVKYSRVAGLGDDLCLAMRAESILIERMAGKSTIGIQVPNHDRETIHLRDVIESETFSKAKSRLALAMGKDINGRVVTADLAAMPHVLIAGSTGSGKSVAINAMITSLLFRTTPAQVRLILVDPKRVELGMYEGIPHLFTPIITEAKLAANALRNAVREMERRLKLLASRSVRNIDQYNTKLAESGMDSLFTETGEEETPLPYIVIIIDELADLMMLDRANVEESITRLAQMARAVGIHLILATQRPSVDVITGLIKANVPTRISFRLASKVDSRTIIDDNGAESLLGRGDMLFRPPGTSRLMRLHAPFVSEKETAAVVDFWKAQGEAEYVEGFLEAPRDERVQMEGDGSAEGDDDEMFDDAVRLVFEFGKASTSLLQRRLRIGYGRAAHLIDLMERDGLVGPADGSRPRELLKHPGWLHEVPAAID
jgi:S-DNA-T family DNA segregation ATPase FtsK/SpoIIIE